MQAELVIKNGLVILETGEVITDVAVQGGKIVAIGQDLSGERVIDATGLVVSPGMVDAHVHITDPGGGYRDEWGRVCHRNGRLCQRGRDDLYGNAFKSDSSNCG